MNLTQRQKNAVMVAGVLDQLLGEGGWVVAWEDWHKGQRGIHKLTTMEPAKAVAMAEDAAAAWRKLCPAQGLGPRD